ncbi:hypothetical protein [Enterovibrio norvegicus]|nr:hypothetical protein [Enterovibrio norvegicus]
MRGSQRASFVGYHALLLRFNAEQLCFQFSAAPASQQTLAEQAP